ncbi:CASP-like protein 5A2 [Bienertia sinuspersici]
MMSHPAVHPVDAPPLSIDNGGGDGPPRIRVKDIPGMPGTPSSLVLRLLQSFFAIGACVVMSTTSDFPSVTAFRYLVAATGLQIIWSLLLAIIDIYGILVQRRFRNRRAVKLFAAGDGITSTLTFAAACASAGITVLIHNDLASCSRNHCVQFETSTGLAFMTWFAALPCFLLNLWTLASR